LPEPLYHIGVHAILQRGHLDGDEMMVAEVSGSIYEGSPAHAHNVLNPKLAADFGLDGLPDFVSWCIELHGAPELITAQDTPAGVFVDVRNAALGTDHVRRKLSVLAFCNRKLRRGCNLIHCYGNR
jgi:hypothetical protein